MGPARARYQVTIAVLAVSAFAFSLLQSLVLPALPTFEHTLHTTETGAAWLLTAYLLSAAVATPVLGRVGDIGGKKRVLVAVLVLLAVGTVLCGLATTLPVMIVGRVIQGAAGAIFPLAFGIIRDEFPPGQVVLGIGLISAILGIGVGAGVVLAGPIVLHLSVHWLFWIPGVMVVVATMATVAWVPESPHRAPARINWTGAAVLSTWLVTLLVAVSEAPGWGWGSPGVLVLFGVTAALIPVWVVVESRATSPLVDMTMMRIRAVWTTNVSALLFGFGMFAMFTTVPEFVQTPAHVGYGFGDSVTRSGLDLLPFALAMLVVAPITARLSAIAGPKWVLVAGGAMGALAYVELALYHAHQVSVLVSSGLLGVGTALGFASMSTLVVQAVPPTQTAVATGMNTNLRSIGGALGAGIAASVVASHLVAGGLPSVSGFTAAFVLSAVAMAAAAGVALAVPGERHRAPADLEGHPVLMGEAEVEVGAIALAPEDGVR